MTLRSFGYWLVLCSLGVAVAATTGLSGNELAASPITAAASSSAALSGLEHERTIFLVIGIAALLFCYRQAWRNFRRGASE
jgi:hypothetical protein